jgi:hypothetical protein
MSVTVETRPVLVVRSRLAVRVLTPPAVVAVAVLLCAAYLRMAWAFPINADGASNALQAADMLHGNPLLHGWTLSDVSFYSTELVHYALLQVFVGVSPGMVHLAAAITYTVLVLAVVALAKGSATGWQAFTRIGIALAVVAVPAPGIAYQTLLSSPDHTGSGVPMLLAWILLDRYVDRRWLPVAVTLVLAWGEIGDPLIAFVGCAPLVLVCGLRALKARDWRGTDARLAGAGVLAVVLAHAVLAVVRLFGGFRVPAPPLSFAALHELGHRAWMIVKMIGVIYGAYRPGSPWNSWERVLDAVHLLAVAVVLAAIVRFAVRRDRDRVNQILVVAIVANLGAELVSMLPADILAAREIVAVLPLGAVLAARVFGPRSGVPARWAISVVLATLLAGLVLIVPRPAQPADNQDIADWLSGRQLTYGLASYWNASNITVTTRRRVTVVPVAGGRPIAPYCWQSRADWYDGTRHDARFIVLDLHRGQYATPETAVEQFGKPVQEQYFGHFVVLVYDANLLTKMHPPCPSARH